MKLQCHRCGSVEDEEYFTHTINGEDYIFCLCSPDRKDEFASITEYKPRKRLVPKGNLSVVEMESRLGVKLPEELVKFMEPRRQKGNKKIEKGKWRCFNTPFALAFADKETSDKVHDQIKQLLSNTSLKLRFLLQE